MLLCGCICRRNCCGKLRRFPFFNRKSFRCQSYACYRDKGIDICSVIFCLFFQLIRTRNRKIACICCCFNQFSFLIWRCCIRRGKLNFNSFFNRCCSFDSAYLRAIIFWYINIFPFCHKIFCRERTVDCRILQRQCSLCAESSAKLRIFQSNIADYIVCNLNATACAVFEYYIPTADRTTIIFSKIKILHINGIKSYSHIVLYSNFSRYLYCIFSTIVTFYCNILIKRKRSARIITQKNNRSAIVYFVDCFTNSFHWCSFCIPDIIIIAAVCIHIYRIQEYFFHCTTYIRDAI